jgi:hypothetical protein
MSYATKEEVIDALVNVDGIPTFRRKRQYRMIYLASGPGEHFYMDFASYPGGLDKEIPREVIDELEREETIERAFEFAPTCPAWKLAK